MRQPLSLSETAVVALAAYRGTRLVVEDTIVDALRDKVVLWTLNGGKARRKLGDLIECPYCAGAYVSALAYGLAVVGLGRRARWSSHAVGLWSVMGGQALLNAVDGVMNHEVKTDG